jgi:aminopeptidase
VLLFGFDGVNSSSSQFKRVAVIGLGKQLQVQNLEGEDLFQYKEAIRNAASAGCQLLRSNGGRKIAVESFGHSQAAAEGAFLGLFKYNKLKTPKDPEPEVEVSPLEQELPIAEAWKKGMTLAACQNFARTLTDTPANLMTPTVFTEMAQEGLAGLENVKVIVRDKDWAEQKKMGCLLGVSKGSDEPLKFLEMHYNGDPRGSKPLIYVGKGVTFDSGGISIKPSDGMGLMKGDMGGAAAVVATIRALAQLRVPVNVIGLTPLCENMPSGHATRPGDVLTSMKGLTVEVDNTDAEGRLILADALHYAHEFNPHTIIDVATLTGAITIALGTAAAGVFSSSNKLWNTIASAGDHAGERMWRMPLFPEYKQQIDSQVADLMNTGGRPAGSCTAATFLKEFVSVGEWAHLDIAGVDHESKDRGYLSKGMTGKPVRTLFHIAESYAAANRDKV